MKIKLDETKNHNGWKKAAICFAILFVISGIYLIIAGNKPYEELSNYVTCSEIKGTPAWIQDNKIIDYGYKKDLKELPEGVSFYYKPECYWCKKQIENFGDLWEKYKKSDLTIDCSQKE